MIIKAFLNRKIYSPILATVLVFGLLLAPLSQNFKTQEAHAQFAVIDAAVVSLLGSVLAPTNIKTTAESTVSAVEGVAQTGIQNSLALKEYSLDTIAWALGNIVIEKMIQSTTQWVNSGFQGKPTFVTNFSSFLRDAADQVAGDYIYNSDALSLLCSPFSVNIKLALDIQYQQSTSAGQKSRTQCTLTGAIANVQNFLHGNFLDGGWDRWAEVAFVPSNNPYGAALEAKAGLEISLQNRKEKDVLDYTIGRGFLSKKNADGSITTPGSVIETQLNNTLNIPAGRLTIADELNELVGALLGQLVQSVFSGGGLRGLTDSSYGANGSQSYFEQMASSSSSSQSPSLPTTQFDTIITLETKYKGLEQAVVSRITGAESSCATQYARPLSAQLLLERTTANTGVIAATNVITKITEYKTDLNLLQNPSTSPATITALLTKYNGTSIPEAEANLMQAFLTYQSSGVLHTSADVSQVELVILYDPGVNKDLWPAFPESVIAQIYIFEDNRCVATP